MKIQRHGLLVETGKDISDGTDNATEQYLDTGLAFAVATYVRADGFSNQENLAKHLASVLAPIAGTDGIEFVVRVWREEM